MLVVSVLIIFKNLFLDMFINIQGWHLLLTSFLGYGVKILVQSILDIIDLEYKLSITKNSNLDTKDKGFCYNAKDNDAGPSRDNGEGSSKDPGKTDTGRVIGPEDYEDGPGFESLHGEDPNWVTGSNLIDFEHKIKEREDKDEINNIKEKLELVKGEYEKSPHIPASKEQIGMTNDKLDKCDKRLAELDQKGKGKSIENIDKGKNPEVYYPRVHNTNFKPAPTSDSINSNSSNEFNDYVYDSEEEKKNIQRAIEESLKDQSDSNKNK